MALCAQETFKQGSRVRWLLVDPVSAGAQGYHDPYFENQVGRPCETSSAAPTHARCTITGTASDRDSAHTTAPKRSCSAGHTSDLVGSPTDSSSFGAQRYVTMYIFG